MIAVSAHELAALEEFELLRENLPPRFRLVVDSLAEEHVQLMRLVNGGGQDNRHTEEVE